METTTLLAPLLDVYGRKILEELHANARLSYARLGRRVGLSPSATAERMRRLEEAGIIRGYTIEVDPDALGMPILAFLRLTCDGGRYQPFLKFVKSLTEVRECHHLTGGDAFILKITASSIHSLERTIEKLLPYGNPTTSIVLSSPVIRSPFPFTPRSGSRPG